MARTSKTKLGGAGRSEAALRAKRGQTEDSRVQQQIAERQRAQASSQLAQGIQQSAGAFQQQAAQAQRQEFAGEQAAAGRDVQRRGQDIQMAAHGLEENPEKAAFEQRRQELEQEVQRGDAEARARAEEQLQKMGEFQGPNVVPTEQRQQQERAKTQYYEDRAAARMLDAKTRARKAQVEADETAFKSAKEQYAAQINQTANLAESVLDPLKANLPGTKDKLKSMFGNNPSPEIQAELEGQPGPNVARLLKSKIIHDSLDFVSETGEWPAPEAVDYGSEAFRQFQTFAEGAGEMLRQRQEMGAISGIRSLRDANRLKNRLAAVGMRTMQMLQTAQQGMERGPMGLGGLGRYAQNVGTGIGAMEQQLGGPQNVQPGPQQQQQQQPPGGAAIRLPGQ